MALLFNYFFEPFDVYVPEHKMDYFWISLLHSLTPIIIVIVFIPFLKNPNIDEKWTVGKEMLLLATFLLCIGITQFLIRDIIYNNPNNWSWKYFYEEIRNTFLVGILLLSILVPLNFLRLNRQNINMANTLTIVGKRATNKSEIFIRTHLKGDDFKLNVENFLFARAEGNYVALYVRNENSVDKHLKRISIKDLELQLSAILNIIRTHRSYLVNLHFVNSVKGNAQGYRLELNGYEELISVSRNMIPQFEARLGAI